MGLGLLRFRIACCDEPEEDVGLCVWVESGSLSCAVLEQIDIVCTVQIVGVAACRNNAHHVPAQVACTGTAGRGSLLDEIVKRGLAVFDCKIDIAGPDQRHRHLGGQKKIASVPRFVAEPAVRVLAGEKVIHGRPDPNVVFR